MRAGRSDADFEEFKETGVHDVVTTEFIVRAAMSLLCLSGME